MALKPVSLDDKYDLSQERVFVSGTQALVRLALMQKERDRRAGLNTAGFVTGYRGSPLGGLDQQFMRAARQIASSPTTSSSRPGLNEELAATALWGTQQAELRGEGKYRWRLRHVVRQGPGRRPLRRRLPPRQQWPAPPEHGGVLALMGDDHTCRILDHGAPVRIPLRRRDDADPQPRRGAGDHRLRRSMAGRMSRLHRRPGPALKCGA